MLHLKTCSLFIEITTSIQEIIFDDQEKRITKSLDEKVEEFKKKINGINDRTALDKDIKAMLGRRRSEKKFRRNLEKLRQKGEDINYV